MKVLICGGRDWDKILASFKALDDFHAVEPITHVIHGAAPGADEIGVAWAKARGITCDAFPADWGNLSHPDAFVLTNRRGTKYDAKAGSRRNILMADQKPAVVLAFPGGKGTRNMINIAKGRGIRVVQLMDPASGLFE